MICPEYSQFNGLINLDKPAGVTSSDCVRLIKKLFNAKKVGHGGTLDPFATGVLPIGIGKGTKQLQKLLEGSKSYSGGFSIGYLTDTLDCEGYLVKFNSSAVTNLNELSRNSQKLMGSYDQKTPMYSARKIKGEKLYNYARKGKTIATSEIPYRSIHIHNFEIQSQDKDIFYFNVKCSKGTYVRQLIQDLLALCNTKDTIGTLEILRRTQVGVMTEEESINPINLFQKLMNGQNMEGSWCHPL